MITHEFMSSWLPRRKLMNHTHHDSWMGGRKQYFLPMYYFIPSLSLVCVCVCVYTERELIICVCTYIHVYICTHMYMCVCACCRFCHVQLFATLWTVAHQAPLSRGFYRQEYWMGFHAFLHGIFLTQGSNPCLLCLLHKQVGSLPVAPPGRAHTSGEQSSPTNTCKWSMHGTWLKQSRWWNMKERKPLSFNSVYSPYFIQLNFYSNKNKICIITCVNMWVTKAIKTPKVGRKKGWIQ